MMVNFSKLFFSPLTSSVFAKSLANSFHGQTDKRNFPCLSFRLLQGSLLLAVDTAVTGSFCPGFCLFVWVYF